MGFSGVTSGLAAILILLGIHQYLRRVGRVQRWADASRSYYFQRVKEGIRAMTAEAENPRSWRPQVLAFSADPRRRARLLRFGSWLEGASGLTASIQIVVGEGAVKRRERQELENQLRAEIEGLGLDVHGRAVLAPDAMEALPVIVQSFGLGPLKANTVLFGWPEESDQGHLAGYVQAVRETHRLGVNVVSMLSDEQRWGALEGLPRDKRRIDVWWQDDDASRLALLTAYLFTRTRDWSRARIRVLARIDHVEQAEDAEVGLRSVLDEARISADVLCIVDPSVEEIARTSAGAGFVFLPGVLRPAGFFGPYDLPTADALGRLPACAVFLAGAPLDLAAGPETELSVKLRAAEELVQTAENRLRTLERQQERLEAEIEIRTGEEWAADDIDAAEQRLRTLERRILSTRAKRDSAQADVANLLGGEGSSHE